VRVAKFKVSRDLMQNREELIKLFPAGTEIVSETWETDLAVHTWDSTVFVVTHDDLPEIAVENGAEIPTISPIIRSALVNPKLATSGFMPEYRFEWDWNLQ
jgi:hypothetical protein